MKEHTLILPSAVSVPPRASCIQVVPGLLIFGISSRIQPNRPLPALYTECLDWNRWEHESFKAPLEFWAAEIMSLWGPLIALQDVLLYHTDNPQSMHTQPQGQAGPHLPQPDPWQPFSGCTEPAWVHKHPPSATWNQAWFSRGWLESNQTRFQNSLWKRKGITFFYFQQGEKVIPQPITPVPSLLPVGTLPNANRAATHWRYTSCLLCRFLLATSFSQCSWGISQKLPTRQGTQAAGRLCGTCCLSHIIILNVIQNTSY